MSTVIRFLEAVGSRPSLSAAEYAASVASISACADERQALARRDHFALNELLGGRKQVMFAVLAEDDEI
ncbi:hypothetical protein [Cognatiluteimonas profundi]|uniref:hypothetical protein n=1 Tax=Cognatiluteimonas profundi TaxID=2594501 RepID=UPI00131E679F|nr:hypothetical protein [Lysobacter profundi]